MKHRRSIAVALALTLVLVACGDDDEDEGASSSGATTEEAASEDAGVTPVEGCGEDSYTDLEVLGSISEVARCEAGAPAAQPFDEPVELTIATASLSSENALPLLLAVEHGEFEKENLEVELVPLAPNEALPLLAQNDIDIQVTSASSAYYTAAAQDFGVRWVMPISWGGEDNLGGLWAKGSDVALEDLADMSVGTAVGVGSPVAYTFEQELNKADLSYADLNLVTLPTADISTAMQNGSVEAGVLVGNFWSVFAEDPGYTHLIRSTPIGEPLSAILFSSGVIEDNREAGVAFTRAWIRTINTYLRDATYKDDPEFAAEAAELLDQDVETFTSQPGSTFDYEVKEGTTDRMQEVFLKLGAVEYEEPLPESELVDRSFVEEAIGHSYDGA